MSDSELVEQLFKSSRDAFCRALATKPATAQEWEAQIVAAYLSGCSQTADFFNRADGEVNPNQVLRALVAVGERLGFQFGRPETPA